MSRRETRGGSLPSLRAEDATRETRGGSLRAVGVTCGVGSMLVGARAAGFAVVGNAEWRDYYHARDRAGRNTFEQNFPGARFVRSVDELTAGEIARWMGAELALGHPECGSYSVLKHGGSGSEHRHARRKEPSDIPLFVSAVARLRPRFFVMDDLPKSLDAFPMEEYASRLPDYDLFPEWVSNWGYGNVQKNRNRMLMIGSLKQERWAFRASEQEHAATVEDAIGDLGEPRAGSNYPNHDPFDLSSTCQFGRGLVRQNEPSTWAEAKRYFAGIAEGKIVRYVNSRGQQAQRNGVFKGYWRRHAHVLVGGQPAIHALRGEPYSLRERARIQGFPDDFVFYGTRLNARGEWIDDRTMTRQTGKAMPVQFCRYASDQVAAHVRGRAFASSGRRLLRPDARVDAAKRWYCSTVGYADQARACGACWMSKTCEIKERVLR